MITALKDLFQQWEANIRDAVDSDLLRNAAFSKHLKLGRKLLVVVEKTNSSLSPFLFCTYVYFLVAGVSFSYMGLAVALTFEHRAGLFLAIGINIYSLMAFWYMWTTSSLGEGMENSKKKARYGKITAGTIFCPIVPALLSHAGQPCSTFPLDVAWMRTPETRGTISWNLWTMPKFPPTTTL